MTRKFLFTTAFSFSLIFLISINPSLDGRWKGVVATPDGNELSVVYNFKTDGNVLTGKAETPLGEVSIDNGKISENNFSFDINVNGTVYPHKGILYTDTCGVDIDFGGIFIHTTIVRDTSVLTDNFIMKK